MNHGRGDIAQHGFIKIVLLVVIALIALGYVGVDIRDVLAAPIVRDNLAYAWGLAKGFWFDYLREPALWVWQHVIAVLWDILWSGIEGLRDGAATSTPGAL